jgi:hypothetical protein
MNQEIKNHVYQFLDSLLPMAGTPASAVRLSPHTAGSTSARTTPPGVVISHEQQRLGQRPAPVFRPFPHPASLQGGFHSPVRRDANGPVVATQQVSRSWLIVGFSRRPAVDLPEFSQIARTSRTRAPVAAYLAEHPPHPPSRAGVDRFSGAQDSVTAPLLASTFITALLVAAAAAIRPLCPVCRTSSSRACRPGCFTIKLFADPS